MRGKKFRRLLDVHRQHIAHRAAAPLNLERFAVEALAAAAFAQHLHIRQETHLDGARAGALTVRAAPAAGIERETAGVVAAHARFAGAGEHAANVVPEADIGRGAGTRRAPDGRLIDFQYAGD